MLRNVGEKSVVKGVIVWLPHVSILVFTTTSKPLLVRMSF